jgi:hypothetical protein
VPKKPKDRKGKSSLGSCLIYLYKQYFAPTRFVERASANLQHRLEATQHEMHRVSKIRLAENSNLLYECNSMRKEIKVLDSVNDLSTMELQVLYCRTYNVSWTSQTHPSRRANGRWSLRENRGSL